MSPTDKILSDVLKELSDDSHNNKQILQSSVDTADGIDELNKTMGKLLSEQQEMRKDAARASRLGSRRGGAPNGRSGGSGGIGGAASGIGSGVGAAASGIGSGLGSVLGGLGAAGSALGMGVLTGGIGIGAAAGGIGYALGQLAELIEVFPDGQQIKNNVEAVLSIGENYESRAEFFKEGGTLFVMLGGLGLGLAAFGTGQALVGLGQWATDEDWTKTLRNNVEELLQIGEGLKVSSILQAGTLTGVMTTLSVGLAAFGVGQFISGVGSWVSKEGWATSLKNSVSELLSILDESNFDESKLESFPNAMGSLSRGIRRFALGNAVQGAVELISADGWAARLSTSVKEILSILDNDKFTVSGLADFPTTMTSLASGISSFGAAQIWAGVGEIMTTDGWATKMVANIKDALSLLDASGFSIDSAAQFKTTLRLISGGISDFGKAEIWTGIGDLLTKEAWATTMVANVKEVMTLTENVSLEEAQNLRSTLSEISGSIEDFSKAKFGDALRTNTSAILGFLTGTNGEPTIFEQISSLAVDNERIGQAATALERLSSAFSSFASIPAVSSNFGASIKEIAGAIPLLRAMTGYNNGVYDPPGFKLGGIDKIDFGPGGILSPDFDLDAVAEKVGSIRSLTSGVSVEMKTEASQAYQRLADGTDAIQATIRPEDMNTLAAIVAAAIQAGSGGGNNTNVGGSTTTTNVTNVFRGAPSDALNAGPR